MRTAGESPLREILLHYVDASSGTYIPFKYKAIIQDLCKAHATSTGYVEEGIWVNLEDLELLEMHKEDIALLANLYVAIVSGLYKDTPSLIKEYESKVDELYKAFKMYGVVK